MKAISREKWIKLFVMETLVFIILAMSFSMTKQDKFSGVDIVGIVSLLLFIPMSVYLFVKSVGRLKDIGMSGWWMLLMLIPVIGWGSLLAILCLRGAEHKKGAVSRAMKIGSISFGGIIALVAFLSFAVFIANTDQVNTGNINNQQKPSIRTAQHGNIINIETAGNLQVTHKLKCLKPEDIKSKYTPADLMPAVVDCIDQERYDDGLFVFLIASLYGSFDKQRVKDISAHQAISALIAKHIQFLDTPNKKKYNQLTMKFFEEVQDNQKNSVLENRLCDIVVNLRRPTYFPIYMIYHGMDAFMEDFNPKSELIEEKNTEEVWREVLRKNFELCFE